MGQMLRILNVIWVDVEIIYLGALFKKMKKSYAYRVYLKQEEKL